MPDISTTQNLLLLLAIFIVALLYSSIGHGGASGYLAILSLFSISPLLIKSSVLLLNISVSLIAFSQYYNKSTFNWKLFWSFAITSIPASFIGTKITISEVLFKKILGIYLLISVFKLLFSAKTSENIQKHNLIFALLIGTFIGLVSGMIGIGGGILLSPIILILHWANMKETAAISALFIFTNSISALIGEYAKTTPLDSQIYLWLIIAAIGGLTGAYLGSKKINTFALKYILTFILLLASIKLIFI